MKPHPLMPSRDLSIDALRARIRRRRHRLRVDPSLQGADNVVRKLVLCYLDADRHLLAQKLAAARINARGSAVPS